ncbi:16S rRNA (adenine(1518)-N(6)/adenine(1519)-N(6))-dimethyltransferase RsmA [Desulfoluna butyratoxydans]|uniref:Ribosomal RNA small subunit methyltransferase A n=1 Tax=Desulfoluna butyratoxydans TaxID=231438 RepID=A0A4U8YI75_9BACT|nr:16S rRNA (adenine(1518)-N(6)/adenine(1519)-N(6))-dimethyltransferase RsmA [Desulfoluna butyratoxydans]VFQ43040.1 ribosomal rna adenine dimethylase [Desulfoluna butyratoxydans]
MTSPRITLAAWDMHAKKKFGQNFLNDPSVPELIAERAGIAPEDLVVEIGPGLGALTVPLAKRAARVCAIEKDSQILPVLRSELLASGTENVEILNEDILNVSLTEIAEAHGGPIIVAGNLPYNISSQILVQMIRERRWVKKALFMFQKELAERITAPEGTRNFGRMAAMLGYCARIRTLVRVDASKFFPRPKVDSEVIEVTFLEDPPHVAKDEALLFAVIKAAFGKRRKNLRNALSNSELPLSPVQAEEVLGAAGIAVNRRAESLTVAEFVELANALAGFLAASPEASGD